MTDQQCIAYYRVSTQGQQRSGLGLEAQQKDVERYMTGKSLLNEYTDIESGKKSEDRPQLLAAIEQCKQDKAVLIIAKLDRLSRNVVFIAQLMESKVKFVCCDMPEADSFTIHIFAALAQKEREMTSIRTKAALKAAQDRGVKLGNPKADAAHCDRMRAAKKPKEYNISLMFVINQLREQNKSFGYIAAELNKQGFRTDRGNDYSATQVFRIFNAITNIPR